MTVNASLATVYASLPATIMLFAEGLGVPREALLHASGLSEQELQDADELVAYDALIGIWQLLLRTFPGRALGLEYAAVVPLSVFGALGYALAHCPTAQDALQCYLRFSRLLDPYIEVDLHPAGSRVQVCLDHEPRVRAMPEVMEMLVAAMHRHAKELVFGPNSDGPAALQVCFTHEASHPAQTYAAFFGDVPVVFGGAYNGIEFEAALLDMAMPLADPGLGRHLITHLEQQLRAVASAPDLSFAQRVCAQLEGGLAEGVSQQEEVARRLNISVRTMQRRLREEQTSFQKVLEHVRQRQALQLLAQTGLTVQEVAYMLGYSEPRAFHRSFRRWTGLSPSLWRRQNSAPGAI